MEPIIPRASGVVGAAALCMAVFLMAATVRADFAGGDGSEADPGNIALTDWNGDGHINISDALGLLFWAFQGAAAHVLGVSCQPISGCEDVCKI